MEIYRNASAVEPMQLTGFAKVLADWTDAVTKLNAWHGGQYGDGPDPVPYDAIDGIVASLAACTATFEQLMGVDAPLLPEAGRVLFCAAPQLGTVIGRTVGNGDARYDVKLASGHIITVPSEFLGGEAEAMLAWAERGTFRHLASPDGKR